MFILLIRESWVFSGKEDSRIRDHTAYRDYSLAESSCAQEKALSEQTQRINVKANSLSFSLSDLCVCVCALISTEKANSL